MKSFASLFRSCALAGAILLPVLSACSGGLAEIGLKGPFPWGERELYVVESGQETGAAAVVTGTVAVASSTMLDASVSDSTARLAFLAGVPYLYTPTAGWTALSGGTALAEGDAVDYRMVFDLTGDRASCTVGAWSLGWVPFGGGDELVGYHESMPPAAAVLTGTHVPPDYDPALPDTQWTLTQKSGYVVLTESGATGTAWKLKLTAAGVLSVTTAGSATAISVRDLPTGAPAITSLAASFLAGNTAVECICLPASLTAIGASAFDGCTKLRVCALPADSRLATVGSRAFNRCTALEEFRFPETLTSLLAADSAAGAFVGNPVMEIVGATLPDALTTLQGSAISDCPNAIVGRLEIGGGDAGDIAVANGRDMFKDMPGITEVVFGKGVTAFASANAFSGCTGITNVVCRNPNGFDFGTSFAPLAGLRQYDLYGWPTGTLVANGGNTRILAPSDNATWQGLVGDASVLTLWDDLSQQEQDAYWATFYGDVAAAKARAAAGTVETPEGRIAGTSGTKTYAGCTVGCGVWIVYDKGFKSLTVRGEAGNLAPDAGQPAFSPAYGITRNVAKACGASFACTAPARVNDGLAVYDVTGYVLRTKDAYGAFTVVVDQGDARSFTFDTAVRTEDAYELTWRMTKTGYMEPQTAWTYDAATGALTEDAATGTPWTFKLTSSGALSVVTRGDSRGINLRTLPTDAGAITSLAARFLYQCATIEVIYLPATLRTVGASAFFECTNLNIVDLPADSQLATLEATGAEDGAFVGNPAMRLCGPTLPDALATLKGGAITDCPLAISGRLTLGGGDTNDLAVVNGQDMFEDMPGITEVVFGAGVTKFASANAFSGCTGITNVVCRNPNGFDFGTYFAALPGLVQYDLCGWPTGALAANGAALRILAPRNDATWLKLVHGGGAAFVRWQDLPAAEQQDYRDRFGDGAVPEGRIAGDAGTVAFEGCTFGCGTWIVFDKGEAIAERSLTVKGEAGDFAPDAGEPAFAPAYGYTYSVIQSVGTNFVCTAPRFTANGGKTYQVTGYALREKDAQGAFTVVTQEGAFVGNATREFAFDTAELTRDAYELTWTMEELGVPPNTQWTWTKSSTTVTLTEVVPEGRTPWKFKLTSGGTLSLAAAVNPTNSSTKVNLRTVADSGCPYAIKATGKNNGNFMNNGIGGTASGTYSKAAGAIIEEIYFPDTLQSLYSYSFANCTNLVVCDFTENSRLRSIDTSAFYKCGKLRSLRLTERLTSLTSGSSNDGPITGCSKLRMVGPTLPDSLTELEGMAFDNCPLAIAGRLTIGGGNTNDMAYSKGKYMFRNATGITEVVFGAGVTKFGSSYAFYNCSGITNIVCRNPAGFNFGTYFSSTMKNVKQYDLYGWPKGTLVTKNYGTRILAPSGNPDWQNLTTNANLFTSWEDLEPEQQETYWTNFPTNGAEEVLTPVGRIAGTSGTKTSAGLTVGYGVWVVFDKVQKPLPKALTVKGEPGDFAPDAGEAAFRPGYGYTYDVHETYGTAFVCQAPRYAAVGADRYEVTNYVLRTKDTNGTFTVVAQEGAFAGAEARRFLFDTAVLTNEAYELTWQMVPAGTVVPKTAWTWDAADGRLTESVTSGTPWAFDLTDEGELSVVTRGTSAALTFRTLPAGATEIRSVASNFLCQCATVAVLYFPASLEAIGEGAFYECANLRVCDLPEDSRLASVGALAFCRCTALESFRFTDRLTALGTAGSGDGAFVQNAAMALAGPTLPDALATLHGAAIAECPNAIVGRLTIGGGDTNDVASANGTDAFKNMTGITEVVFGAGVTGYAGANAFGGCTGITNVVCRNPAGFDFGTSFAALPGLAQYDFYGWPTGTLVGNNYSTRILAPRDNATWRALVADEKAFLPWDEMTEAQKNTYWRHWPQGGEDTPVPAGRIAGSSGTKTYGGLTVGYGTWVVFDKGGVVVTKALTVKGEPGDYPAASGETAFAPDYGFTEDVLTSYGTNFVCTAPRFTANGGKTYQVTGYALREKDADGRFTVLTRSDTFPGNAAREFTFDTAELTRDAYELTWTMEELGVPPNTQWTWTQKSGVVYLTEAGIPEGQTPWKFILSSGGTLSVNTVVDATSSKKINLRTIPADCPNVIKTAGRYNSTGKYGYFMNNGKGGTASQAYSQAAGSIIEEIYLPDTLTKLDTWAFANCTNLVVCDFTENSQLATIGYGAIYLCNELKHLRLTESLKTIAGKNNNASGIQSCSKLQIDGPILPDSLTTLGYRAFDSCPNAIQGRLTLGGADDHDLAFSDTPSYMFRNDTGITEVVFGAGVTKFASSSAFSGCTGITNIVCRNPDGFNFGDFASLTNLRQYDFEGWPKGTLVGKNTATRILAPHGNATWRALTDDTTVFTPWASLTSAQQDVYWQNFYGDGAEGAKALAAAGKIATPAGKIAGTKGSKTYANCTIGYGTWVVFKPGKGLVFFVW